MLLYIDIVQLNSNVGMLGKMKRVSSQSVVLPPGSSLSKDKSQPLYAEMNIDFFAVYFYSITK